MKLFTLKRMKSIVILWAPLCLLSGLPGMARAAPAPVVTDPATAQGLGLGTPIRVRLAGALGKVQVRGFDLRIYEGVGNPSPALGGPERRLASSPDRLSEWTLSCQGGRVRALPLHGKGKALDLREPVSIQSPAGFLKFRGRPYREELQIHASEAAGSGCEVVNHVELEKYLDGLVNSEFNARWNGEAIGAQVVAARTYALYQISLARKVRGQNFDVDATTQDQVYDGSMREDFRASQSVERTRGMVLTVGSENRPLPVKAFYHSTCGGMTELPEHVWGSAFPGFRRAVSCPYCGRSPAISWSLELKPAQVVQAFSRATQGRSAGAGDHSVANRSWPRGWKQALGAGQLLEVRAGGFDAEGRVASVVTTWALDHGRGGSQMELWVSGARFREWIGPARFRSANFQIQAQGDHWRFQGRGNGHGVGMCQWGAKTMGERGFTTASILKHYYPDAILRKLW